MKAITIYYPYAIALINGIKQYETRNWSTDYRGLIAIHSAMRNDRHVKAHAEYIQYHVPELTPLLQTPVLGAVLGICEIEDVVLISKMCVTEKEQRLGDWGSYRKSTFAWKMKVIEKFDKPISATGRQRLWNWEFE